MIGNSGCCGRLVVIAAGRCGRLVVMVAAAMVITTRGASGREGGERRWAGRIRVDRMEIGRTDSD